MNSPFFMIELQNICEFGADKKNQNCMPNYPVCKKLKTYFHSTSCENVNIGHSIVSVINCVILTRQMLLLPTKEVKTGQRV